TPTAGAANDRCDLFDDVAGLDAIGQVRGDRDQQGDLALAEIGAEHNHRRGVFLAQLIRQLAQRPRIDSARATANHLDSVYLADCLRHAARVTAAARQLLLESE